MQIGILSILFLLLCFIFAAYIVIYVFLLFFLLILHFIYLFRFAVRSTGNLYTHWIHWIWCIVYLYSICQINKPYKHHCQWHYLYNGNFCYDHYHNYGVFNSFVLMFLFTWFHYKYSVIFRFYFLPSYIRFFIYSLVCCYFCYYKFK